MPIDQFDEDMSDEVVEAAGRWTDAGSVDVYLHH
jgi:hypothetical protein